MGRMMLFYYKRSMHIVNCLNALYITKEEGFSRWFLLGNIVKGEVLGIMEQRELRRSIVLNLVLL